MESFKLTARPFKVQWKDDDGEQNDIQDEVTLDEAIEYHHSTDESSVTIFIQVSREYDGPSHSGPSPLASKEDLAEGCQVSSARGEFSSLQQGGDAMTTSSNIIRSRSRQDRGETNDARFQDAGPARSHILNSDSCASSTDEGGTGRSIVNSGSTDGRSPYNPTGTESAHLDDPPAADRLEEQSNASSYHERPSFQAAREQAWLLAQAPHQMMGALDALSLSDSFSLNTDSPLSDGLPDTDIPPERREYYTGSRSSVPARDSEYEAPVNRSQPSKRSRTAHLSPRTDLRLHRQRHRHYARTHGTPGSYLLL